MGIKLGHYCYYYCYGCNSSSKTIETMLDIGNHTLLCDAEDMAGLVYYASASLGQRYTTTTGYARATL